MQAVKELWTVQVRKWFASDSCGGLGNTCDAAGNLQSLYDIFGGIITWFRVSLDFHGYSAMGMGFYISHVDLQ
jgi:hypothetical protein